MKSIDWSYWRRRLRPWIALATVAAFMVVLIMIAMGLHAIELYLKVKFIQWAL